MPTLKSVQRKFKNRLEKQGEQSVRDFFFEGELVEVANEDPNNTVSVFVYDENGARVVNQMWCQLKGETNPTQVWAWMVSPYPGLPVWLFNIGQGYEVFRAKSLEGTFLENEALQSVSFGPLFNEVNKFTIVDRNYQPGMVIKSPQGGLWVQVYAVRYLRKDGTAATLMPQEIDLTPYLPSTSGTWAWVLVCIDPETNALTAVTGDEYALPTLLTRDLLDDIETTGLIPLDALKLEDSTTEITAENEFAFGRVLLQHRPKNNFEATTAPGVNDDDSEGYEVGSVWVDVTAGVWYGCVDASTGSAVWVSSSATAFYQTVEDNGTPVTQRGTLNFTGSVTVTDNAGNGSTDVDIAAYNQTIAENGVAEPQRATLNFVDGVGTTPVATDDAGNNETDLQIDLDIDALTADGAPDQDTDYVAIWDDSAGTHKKVLLANLPGGGGSATGSHWQPLAQPVTPNAINDEFADNSGGVPTGFTAFDFGGNTTVQERAYGLHMFQTAHAGPTQVAGVYKALPADPSWSVWTKCNIQTFALGTGSVRCGIALLENTTSAGDMLVFGNMTNANTAQIVALRYTAYNAGEAVVATLDSTNRSLLTMGMYLRVRCDGTNLLFDFSYDGVSSVYFTTVTLASLTFTPAYLALCISNNNTGTVDIGVTYDFFRYTDSDVGAVPFEGQRVNYSGA